jgi:hypothetical protein
MYLEEVKYQYRKKVRDCPARLLPAAGRLRRHSARASGRRVRYVRPLPGGLARRSRLRRRRTWRGGRTFWMGSSKPGEDWTYAGARGFTAEFAAVAEKAALSATYRISVASAVHYAFDHYNSW